MKNGEKSQKKLKKNKFKFTFFWSLKKTIFNE